MNILAPGSDNKFRIIGRINDNPRAIPPCSWFVSDIENCHKKPACCSCRYAALSMGNGTIHCIFW